MGLKDVLRTMGLTLPGQEPEEIRVTVGPTTGMDLGRIDSGPSMTEAEAIAFSVPRVFGTPIWHGIEVKVGVTPATDMRLKAAYDATRKLFGETDFSATGQMVRLPEISSGYRLLTPGTTMYDRNAHALHAASDFSTHMGPKSNPIAKYPTGFTDQWAKQLREMRDPTTGQPLYDLLTPEDELELGHYPHMHVEIHNEAGNAMQASLDIHREIVDPLNEAGGQLRQGIQVAAR